MKFDMERMSRIVTGLEEAEENLFSIHGIELDVRYVNVPTDGRITVGVGAELTDKVVGVLRKWVGRELVVDNDIHHVPEAPTDDGTERQLEFRIKMAWADTTHGVIHVFELRERDGSLTLHAVNAVQAALITAHFGREGFQWVEGSAIMVPAHLSPADGLARFIKELETP
jgi:hypothetical protein